MANTRKTSTATTNKDSNYIIIEFGYDCRIVLPYEQGMAVVKGMEFAECLDRNNTDYHDPTITPIDFKRGPEIRLMSQEEYVRRKSAALLGVKPESLLEPPPEKAA